MTTSAADLKRLWGRAAGRCSHPGCRLDCLTFLESEDLTVIGEMAHIVARSPDGPRGQSRRPDDTYSNLILLCPTHHTLVDKAPEGAFPAQTLLKWKVEHERAVGRSLAAQEFSDRTSFSNFIRTILAENRACWATYGPESAGAQKNPNSTAGCFWPFRKFSVIVPNNRRLISAIRANRALLNPDEYRIACDFIEHAEGFERNCTIPTENVPRFPVGFEKMFLRETR